MGAPYIYDISRLRVKQNGMSSTTNTLVVSNSTYSEGPATTLGPPSMLGTYLKLGQDCFLPRPLKLITVIPLCSAQGDIHRNGFKKLLSTNIKLQLH
jgi:hypothetical protein